MEKICKPYTYAIGWSKYKVWYYGVRFSKNSYVGDIWVDYFTSSSLVKEFVSNNGQPDIIKVCKVFECVDDAILHEHKFLVKVKANTNPNFLNAHCAAAFKSFETNSMKNEKTRQKMIRTKTLQNLIKFVRNKQFVAHPKKIARLNKYLEIISKRHKKYPRIVQLIEFRINLCNLWVPKPYPKTRKKTKRGPRPNIARLKLGKVCYHDPITKIGKMFGPDDIIPEGWIRGLIKSTPNNNTPEVRKKISEGQKRYRSQESEEKKKQRVDAWRKSREIYNV